MPSRPSAVSTFEQLFDAHHRPAPPAVNCAVQGCDRRPAKGSRFCGCCRDDRAARRVVIAGADEFLPFDERLARNHSAGPVPFMTKGDAACREVKKHRRNGKVRRDKFAHPAGDPRRRTGMSFSPRPVN